MVQLSNPQDLCPGFNDTRRSDTEILKEITEELSAIKILGFKLRGIIWLHRITDNRMTGSDIRNLDIFKKLVGEGAFSNVVLATTMWGKVTDMSEAVARDRELREEFWSDMSAKGSTTTRFDGSEASAQGIVSQLLGRKAVVLKVQEELVHQNFSLNQTLAGAFLEPRVETEEADFRRRLEELEYLLKFERDNNARLKAKRSQKRNSEALKQRMADKEILNSKPGKEIESKLEAWKQRGHTKALQSIQALAAVCSITFGIVGFVLGGHF
ncbi:hypothetical protein G7Y89_g3597 [Cudoniella acicularis]|uniref:AIG1-type G domain-containing protein n=1 Tax=Cudoniella acicularis TaxID=354080 RepID=A0A8H4W5F6_9HELO|nr:hypothetical protein G7Y89_g3597 [Cudoniella acicularis]